MYYRPEENNGDLRVIHKFESSTVSSLRMKLADDNMSVSAQQSSITLRASTPLSSCEMSQEGPAYTINYALTPENNQSATPFTLNLNFDPLTCPFKVADGKIHMGANKNDGFVEMKFIPAGMFEGSVQIDNEKFDFNGQGLCFRQFLGVKPHNAAKRWNCAYFSEIAPAGQPRRILYMIQMQCSAQYNHETVHFGYYFDGQKVKAVTSAGNRIDYARTKKDPVSGYMVPDHFEYHWAGTDCDGKSFEASCSGVPSARVSRIDLMEAVPSMLRRVAESITSARPIIYQYFDRNIEAIIDGQPVRGHLFQEYSFLLEDPSQHSSPKLS